MEMTGLSARDPTVQEKILGLFDKISKTGKSTESMKKIVGLIDTVMGLQGIQDARASGDPAEMAMAVGIPGMAKKLPQIGKKAIQKLQEIPDIDNLIASMTPKGEVPQKVWHSSPHDYDEPSLAHIGTGEGTQVEGPGYYLASHPIAGASHYRDQFTSFGLVTPEGKLKLNDYVDSMKTGALNDRSLARMLWSHYGEPDMYGTVRESLKNYLVKDIEHAKKFPGSYETDWLIKTHRDKLKRLDELEKMGAEPFEDVSTYEYNLHAKPEEFLDWYKPIGKQKGIPRKLIDVAGEGRNQLSMDMTGKKAYGLMQKMEHLKTPRLSRRKADDIEQPEGMTMADAIAGARGIDYLPGKLTGKLNEAGIIGTKHQNPQYMDPGNTYALWDLKRLELLRKWGLLPPVAAGAAASGGLMDRMEEPNG